MLARAFTGDIRITVREEVDLPEDDDLILLENGDFQRAEDELLPVGNGTIIARLGSVLLRVGDDVNLHQNSQVLAGESIDIYGDSSAAALIVAEHDPNYGTDMLLRGRIVAGCITPGDPQLCSLHRNADLDHPRSGASPTSTRSSSATPQACRRWPLAAPKETLGNDGYIYLGSKTRVYGDETTNPTGNDGEDQFLVYYLQSTLVTTSPSTGTGSIATAGHSLTLDGLADTDTYNIWTTGSRGVPRNYLINILDTGAENDGVDEAFVHGFDSDVNGDDTPNDPPPSDDIFLLRRVTCIDTETQDGLGPIVDGSAGCVSPTEFGVDRPGFVAMLHGNVDDFRFNGPGDTDTGQNTNVQRVNYDSGLNGRLTVLGYGGNDHFYSDDTSVAIALDGGEGNDVFQIGQQFGTKRSAAGISVPGEPTDGGALLPQDTFPDLIATTRGWLSPGISAPMVVHGGTGEDRFTVYSNQAELRLEGDDNNDLFVIRAFALAAVCDRDATGDGLCTLADVDLDANEVTGAYPLDVDDNGVCSGTEMNGFGQTYRIDNNDDGVCNNAANMTSGWLDDIIPLDANGVAVPIIGGGFSTDKPLDIRTGGGDDEVKYNINAPVSVDGGAGVDKLVVLGTEFADRFVMTAGHLRRGAHRPLREDRDPRDRRARGRRRFFDASTAFGVASRIIGGLGSDTMNVAETSPRTSSRSSWKASAVLSTMSSRRPATSTTTACRPTASRPTSQPTPSGSS